MKQPTVSNQKTIFHLSLQSMKAAKTRNIISILAISLTAVLFTALFTIIMSISYSFEQSNFRQAGTCAHGCFKYVTKEQLEILKKDPAIKEYGVRQILGMPMNEPFSKAHVEVSYCDANEASYNFLIPVEGRLPKEGTHEAATDTRVLSLLGITPEIGTEFTLTFDVGGIETSQTFTLCGYWDYDEAAVASHVLLPQSLVESLLEELNPPRIYEYIGTYDLYIMLADSRHIEESMNAILARYGYQSDTPSATDTYVNTGVNWGYLNAQILGNLDFGMVLSFVVILLLILFTGYLIIYNIFQIAVSGDVRFYGLLKTIGTTRQQIRRMILYQSLLLSSIGIPLGLLIGYGIGALLTPIVLSNLDGIPVQHLSVSPLLFIGAAFFSLITVMISCKKPGKMAAKVSPIEAVRYTESTSYHKNRQKADASFKNGASLLKMAWANLGRNKKRTVTTICSLSLAIVLLNITVTFTNGFDMDKYLSSRVITDFQVASADYFNVAHGWNADSSLPEEVITAIEAQGGIKAGGRTYGKSSPIYNYVKETDYRKHYSRFVPKEALEDMISQNRTDSGLIMDNIQLSGMEDFCLDKLTVVEGDISKLYQKGNYIAAVYFDDDYGNLEEDSNWAKLGDTVTICYENTDGSYQEKNYEVVSLVICPHALSYRFYSAAAFIMNAETFKQDTGTDAVLYYAFDTQKEAVLPMEQYLTDFTNNIMPSFDYESKSRYAEEFYSFSHMFLFMGSALSFIVALIGILNFFQSILTSILTRRHEFAILQAVGMTGKQLKTMLVLEGLLLAFGSLALSSALIVLSAPFVSKLLGGMFWFYTYHFTLLPVLVVMPLFALLGLLLPFITYHYAAKQSIVERLRTVE